MAYVWDPARRELIYSSSRENCDAFADGSTRELVVTDTRTEPWRRHLTLIPGGAR